MKLTWEIMAYRQGRRVQYALNALHDISRHQGSADELRKMADEAWSGIVRLGREKDEEDAE